MDIGMLKEHILENDLIPKILEELGCHHIKQKDGYVTAGNPDGDNPSAICVYENTMLTTIDYTREIGSQGSFTDLISLVEYFIHESFPYAIKWICDKIDLDYYTDWDEDLPASLQITKVLLGMQTDGDTNVDDEKPLRPISENILTYYKPYVNDVFKDDNVSYLTQREFELGYDEVTNRITIPIRDDLGNLVGVKGRYFFRDVPEDEMKFVYLERCARSQILYGLYKTLPFIKRANRCFVVEAEKGVQQLWEYGFCESVATGGKKLARTQIDKLTRLGVPLIFVFDKDVTEEELRDLANRFIEQVEVYALIDKKNILDDKDSPTDNVNSFTQMLDECLIKLK